MAGSKKWRLLAAIPLLVYFQAQATDVARSEAAAIGGCRFDPESQAFAGTVDDQLACLLKKVRPKGTGADRQPVPTWISQNADRPVTVTPEQVRRYLVTQGIEPEDLGRKMVVGDAPRLRYFVIHDTSSPELVGVSHFPSDINQKSYKGNSLSVSRGTADRVNLIITRDGRSRVLQDWIDPRPAPATKLEQTNYAPRARAIFVHVENIQPRIKPPGSFAWIAPQPGLGPDQEQRLALAYVVASMRAGRWLLPAYHFNIDQGIPDGHDDPQNMDLPGWAGRVQAIVGQITAP